MLNNFGGSKVFQMYSKFEWYSNGILKISKVISRDTNGY